MAVRRAIHFITIFTGLAFSGMPYAQTCSGGIDGGMDATGNQCNIANLEGSFFPMPEHVVPMPEHVVRPTPKMAQRGDPGSSELAAATKAKGVTDSPCARRYPKPSVSCTSASIVRPVKLEVDHAKK